MATARRSKGKGEATPAVERPVGVRPWRAPDPRRMDAPAGPLDDAIVGEVLGPALRAWAAWLRDGDDGDPEAEGPPEAVRYPATAAGLAWCLRSGWRRPEHGRARQLAVVWWRALDAAERDLLGRLAALDELTLLYCAPNALRYRLGLRPDPLDAPIALPAPRGAPEEPEGAPAPERGSLWAEA